MRVNGAKNRIDTGRWEWVDGDRVQDAFFSACVKWRNAPF
jgi:hypothetical protein